VPGVKSYKWRLNPVWHRMLYSGTHMATYSGRQRVNALYRWSTQYVPCPILLHWLMMSPQSTDTYRYVEYYSSLPWYSVHVNPS